MVAPAMQIEIIRSEMVSAVNAIVSAVGCGLGKIGLARDGDPTALGALEADLCSILEACSFQDLVGQRLDRLCATIVDAGEPDVVRDPLLNGPADHGQGLDQAAADLAFADAPAGADHG